MEEVNLKQMISDLEQFKAKAKEEIKTIGETTVETKSAIEKLQADVFRRIDELQASINRPPVDSPPVRKSFAERLAESDSFKSLRSAWRMNAAGAVQIEDVPLLQRKTTITSDTVGVSTPGILVPERVQQMVKPPVETVRVRDLIPFGTTTQNAVEFPQEQSYTSEASVVNEASDKPESEWIPTISAAYVRTIAHWIPASNQVLADLPMLQSYIEQRLLEGLADAEDAELLFGDNTNLHLNGICTQATAVAGSYAAAGDTYIDQILSALMELAADKYVADGIVMNPIDWLSITKIKTEDGGTNKGAYILGGPGSDVAKRLWQIPVSVTTAMTQGSFLVGQFRGSVQGFDRLRSAIAVSTEHADYFVKNLVCIRAEERIALAVYRPNAFRFGEFVVNTSE